jgi:2OG-Fe(II) oxygenase superfamily
MSDGLQILRYNLTTAYVPHMDYLDDNEAESYNYDSAGAGGNRFATILLYFTDMGENDGGETVFPRAWPSGPRVDVADAIKQLRESDQGSILKHGSWEEEMTAECRTRLAIRPKAQRAVLFYSQVSWFFGTAKTHAHTYASHCSISFRMESKIRCRFTVDALS